MATSDLTGDLDQTRRHAAGRTNLSTGRTPPASATAAQSGPRPAPQFTQLPVGIGLTPEQQAAQRRTQQRQAMADQLTQTRQSAGRVVNQVAGGIGDAYSTVLNAATVVPRTIRGIATGEIPVTFDDRLPGQAKREAARARQQARQSAEWVANNPEQAQAAQQFREGIVERARAAWMAPPGGYPGNSAPDAQQPIAEAAPSSPALSAPAGANLLTGSAPPPAPGVPAAGSPGQQPGQPMARIEPGQNLAPDLTRNARAQLPVNSVDNRIVRDGNSFSANTPIRAGATIGSTDTLVGRQQDDGQPMARTNSYSGQDAMESYMLARMIRDQDRLERSNPNPLTVVRDTSRGGMQGFINERLNERDARTRQERSDQHRERILQGQQGLLDAVSGQRDRRVAADERLYNRSQDAIAERRNQLGDELTGQQIEQGQMIVAQQRQLRDLSSRMVDPSLTEVERAEAQRAYQALTTTGSDTLRAQSDREAARQRAIVDLYRQYSGNPPFDSQNNPIPFEQWAQPALQAMGQGEAGQQQPRRSTVTRAEVEQTATNRGMTPDQVIQMLEAIGVTVSS